MLNSLKKLGKNSVVYSMGNMASKLIGFILLPLYTKYLTESEYGFLGIIEITIMVFNQVLSLGQSQAYLKLYSHKIYKAKRKVLLFTLVSFLLVILVILLISYQVIFRLFFLQLIEYKFFILGSYIVVLRIINNLFLNVLRSKEEAKYFAIVNILKVAIILGFNIFFIANQKIGVIGILYSYLIGDSVLFILLSIKMFKEIEIKFDPQILKYSIPFGFPLIFTMIASNLLNISDKYILKIFCDFREVGIYNLGYKFASIVQVFFIQSFLLAFLPSAYKMFGKVGDKRYYSKLLTYFVFVLSFMGLGLSFFSQDIILSITENNKYLGSYKIVPILTFAFIFSGARYVVNLGLYLKNKTKYIAYITIIASILNVGLNFLLIPNYKYIGAAIASLVSFIILLIITYFVSNKFYKIPFEIIKFFKMIFLTLSLYLLSLLSINLPIYQDVIYKLFLLLLFPIVLYFWNFYEKIELLRVKEFVIKILNSLRNTKKIE